MAKQIKKAPEKAEANVGEMLSKSEKFFAANKKLIVSVASAIVIIVVAIIGIRQYYLIPQENSAQEAMFPCENYFSSQQWDLALHGDSVECIGFLGVIDDYSITKSAKLAQAYAGICLYRMGFPEEAIDYLKKYKADDALLAPTITSLIGDCLVETGKTEQAIPYFKKAAEKTGEGSTLGPIFLNKAARAYEEIKDYKNAANMYRIIKEQYPNSALGLKADKYIEKFEAELK
ncbi:MAG: tetratricopeptide repeat protein [Dysgonamonadaceae bacterium]|jgi:tetratricopeptide (TPR) repeat protein|nr:tetratricopeptide repeat protein [Dysgonamonadaceae bacterium]